MAFQLAHPRLARASVARRKVVNRVPILRGIENRLDAAEVERVRQRLRQARPRNHGALVIHAYYPEMLPPVIRAVRERAGLPLDIYITAPFRSARELVAMNAVPHEAMLLGLPNRGRDVLPFLVVADGLRAHGYEHVLKLHTKKSPHRYDGATWQDEMLRGVLPHDELAVSGLARTLQDPATGIIGPVGQYLSLDVNLEANRQNLAVLLTRLWDEATAARVLLTHRSEFGFFAGSMFWTRLDALQPLLAGLAVDGFDTERGQIDGTLAHAIERMFSLTMQLTGRRLFTLHPQPVEIDPGAGQVPDWSGVLKPVVSGWARRRRAPRH